MVTLKMMTNEHMNANLILVSEKKSFNSYMWTINDENEISFYHYSINRC